MQSGNDVVDQRYADAAYAYGLGHFNEALAGFSELARSGHAMATTYLAEMYLRGEGVLPNVEKGVELLELAISRGDSSAAFNLGALHRNGAYCVPKDLDKSRRFFLLAKELGCELSVDDFLR